MTISPSEFARKWNLKAHFSIWEMDQVFDDLESLNNSSFGPVCRGESNEAVRARARFGLFGEERAQADAAADPNAQVTSASVGAPLIERIPAPFVVEEPAHPEWRESILLTESLDEPVEPVEPEESPGA